MSQANIIALDAMGGDFGPSAIVPGAALALREAPDLRFIFFGDEQKIRSEMRGNPLLDTVSTIIHTDKVIGADEKPSAALRSGKGSSMRLAIEAVESGQANSMVSAGNTGAFMATAKIILRCLPGINRPAIASMLPTMQGQSVVLDLGANISCDAEILVQFAVMGAVYARVVKGIHTPSLGLLNIGSEETKGHDQLRAAAAILAEIDFPAKFVGFIEGNDIPEGAVDVVVTDGFTGNVALKVAEGVGKLTSSFLKSAFKSSPLAMLGALLANSALNKVKHRMDPRYYNGGMFLGLSGICVKSHGGMDAFGTSRAILVAANLVRHGYNDRVAAEIKQIIEQDSFIAGLATAGGA